MMAFGTVAGTFKTTGGTDMATQCLSLYSNSPWYTVVQDCLLICFFGGGKVTGKEAPGGTSCGANDTPSPTDVPSFNAGS